MPVIDLEGAAENLSPALTSRSEYRPTESNGRASAIEIAVPRILLSLSAK